MSHGSQKPPPYEPPIAPPAYPSAAGYPSAGYYGVPPVGLPPSYQMATNKAPVAQGVPVTYQLPQPVVVYFYGTCPSCGVGMLEDEYTCLGIFLAICCFPLGILCCHALRIQRCTSCGAVH